MSERPAEFIGPFEEKVASRSGFDREFVVDPGQYGSHFAFRFSFRQEEGGIVTVLGEFYEAHTLCPVEDDCFDIYAARYGQEALRQAMMHIRTIHNDVQRIVVEPAIFVTGGNHIAWDRRRQNMLATSVSDMVDEASFSGDGDMV